MTVSVSNKFRAVGGASIIAMATGISGASVANATAPAPVLAVPTPAAPAAPANVEECTLITTAMPPEIICAPGTDPDGLTQPFNGISATVDAGSQVQGEINLLGNVTATVNGDFVTPGRALDLGGGATVVNNGTIVSTTTPLSGIIRTGNGSTITNNGIITSTQSNLGGIETNSNSTVTNNGEISLSGFGVIGITGTGSTSAFGGDTGVTLVNSMTGSIIVGNGVAGILLGEGATVTNDGLVQSFGTFAPAIIVGNNSTVTNNGNVQTSGNSASGIQTGTDATVVNSATGNVFTFGDNLAGVLVGTNSTVTNDGTILTQGDSAISVAAASGSTVTNNATGQITTTGMTSHGVVITGDGTLNNSGLIQTTGTGAEGVIITGAGTITNSGTISAGDARGVDVAGVATITNNTGGVIAATNGDAVRLNSDGSTLTNDGRISTGGAGALAVNAQVANTTVVNTGIISTTGTGTVGVLVGETSTVTNSGSISTAADNTVAVAAGTNSTVSNLAGGTISTIGVNAGAIVFNGAVGILSNAGTISTLRADATAVLATGVLGMENSGTINATTGRAIDVAGLANFINRASGTISSGGSDAIRLSSDAEIRNLGTITGVTGINAAGTGTQIIFNGGTIAGTGGTAASLGSGNDAFVLLNDGTATGTVDGGADTDVFASIITDTTDRTFNLDLLGTQFVNFEDARFGSQSFDFFTGMPGAAATGVMTLTGTANQDIGIINTGILDGTVNGTVNFLVGVNTGIAPVFTVTANGAIAATGDGNFGFNALGQTVTVNNAGSISTTGNNTVGVLVGDGSTVNNDGSISSTGDSALGIAAGDGSTINNNAAGTISTTGTNSGAIVFTAGGTLNNAGSITTGGADSTVVTMVGSGSVVNDGTIAGTVARAIDIGGAGTVSNNASGVISSGSSDGIRLNGGGTVLNQGAISGDTGITGSTAGEIVINSGTITGTTAAVSLGAGEDAYAQINDGTATGTVDGGDDSDVFAAIITDTTDRTFDLNSIGTQIVNFEDLRFGSQTADFFGGMMPAPATGVMTLTGMAAQDISIVNTAILDGTVNGTVTLLAGNNAGITPAFTVTANGSIVATGDGVAAGANDFTITNRGSISGATGVTSGAGNVTVANFGTITGTGGDGAALGGGSDQFQQWTGATVNGDVDLGDDDDSFVLEGTATSITGTVDGGAGTDTAILGGTFDKDVIVGFEEVTLGTLFDLNVVGNRTFDGNVTVDGTVNFDLGVDSITNNGNLTLEAGSVINIATPLDEALVNQTVAVIQDNGTTVNNGVTININDDDLLLTYTPIVGSVLVRVTAANPLLGNADGNVAAFGAAVAGGLTNGTLNAANFAALNGLSTAQFLTAAQDALPSLSEGLGREIFETSNLASQALDRHLAGNSSAIWGQFSVRGATQDALSLSADGYESDQLVFTAGVDIMTGEDGRVGVMASYADIDTQDLRNDVQPTENINAESIKLGAYAGITLFDRGFFNAEVAYLTGSADTARSGFFGPITSEIDFDGWVAQATFGYDLLPDDGVWLTPSVGINATQVSFDDAQEVGGFGFLIQRGDATFAEISGGLEFGAQVSKGVKGFVSGTVIRDLEGSDDPRSFRLSSAQLSTIPVNLPLREQNRFELAAGATIDASENFAIDLGYHGDFNDGYRAHAARATVRIGF